MNVNTITIYKEIFMNVNEERKINEIELTCVTPSCELIDIAKLVKNRFKDSPERKALELEYSPCEIVMEYIGRICYNSHDVMTDDSITSFLSAAANKGHRSIFEFGQLQYTAVMEDRQATMVYDLLINNPYVLVNVRETEIENYFIVIAKGSPRAFMEILELFLEDDLNCIPVAFYLTLYDKMSKMLPSMVSHWETIDALAALELQIGGDLDQGEVTLSDITAVYANSSDFTKFLAYVTCGRDVSHEIVRHRPVSYMQESQRYIRFDANNPYVICMGSKQLKDIGNDVKEFALMAFRKYSELMLSTRPENARIVLPNCAKTSIFIYADKKEFRHFFRMRQSKFAYPPIKEVFDSLYFQLIDKKFI